jgi:hypothetical protein
MTTSRQIFAKTGALIALIFGALAGIAILKSDRVKAFNPQPDPPAFAAIGITNSQTALISARFDVDESRRGTANPVTVQFLFRDMNGNELASSVQTIAPEHTALLTLNGGMLGLGGDGMRAELQPSIKILNNPNERSLVRITGAAEVFDNFGPDAGKSRLGAWANHNETLMRDTTVVPKTTKKSKGEL